MSVTGHRDVRLADDNYQTPEACVRLLLPHLQRGDVLEPCCGEGAIGKVVHEAWNGSGDYVEIKGFEIDPDRAAIARDSGYFDNVATGDFLQSTQSTARLEADLHRWPLVITNPPFSLAMPFLERSLRVADTVAFLLRLAWLASAERNSFHRSNPSDLIILPKRPSFAKFASCAGGITLINGQQAQQSSCGWKDSFKPNEQHPKTCPTCGGKVKVSTSDSADYGWFIFGPGRGGRIIHPQIDVAEVNKQFDGAAAQLEELTR